ncbi:MAG: alpha/beta fold hydrolase [Solirubrobacteraceae bacterium]
MRGQLIEEAEKSGVPIVLVHGNPETDVVWDLLVERLVESGHDEPVCLSPPGFGAPVPGGFGATSAEYVAWLIAELEDIGEPVDLVGHDVGGAHAIGVAMSRPDLLRSWSVDGLGVLDPDYEWHELAQVWQTPGAGEAWIAANLKQSPEQRAAFLNGHGMEASIAARVATGFDEAMGACILSLYRSRRREDLDVVSADLGAAAARPGLAVLATADRLVGSDEQKRRSAARAGAVVAELPGLRHWWMTENDGRPGVEALSAFWSSLAT